MHCAHISRSIVVELGAVDRNTRSTHSKSFTLELMDPNTLGNSTPTLLLDMLTSGHASSPAEITYIYAFLVLAAFGGVQRRRTRDELLDGLRVPPLSPSAGNPVALPEEGLLGSRSVGYVGCSSEVGGACSVGNRVKLAAPAES